VTRLHGGCVALAGRGVLLRGPSGSGKSELALALIDGGARLVSDDQTDLMACGRRLFAAPPKKLAGLLEIRGAGIVRLSHLALAELFLVVDLVPPDQVARLPEPLDVALDGITLRGLRLAIGDASAAAKIRAILAFKLVEDLE